MKLRCYKAIFPVAFRAEVLGVLIAVLPVGVFAVSTMNSGRWFHQEPSNQLASPVATARALQKAAKDVSTSAACVQIRWSSVRQECRHIYYRHSLHQRGHR